MAKMCIYKHDKVTDVGIFYKLCQLKTVYLAKQKLSIKYFNFRLPTKCVIADSEVRFDFDKEMDFIRYQFSSFLGYSANVGIGLIIA